MVTGWPMVAATAIYPTADAKKADNDLRVASLSIAAYDYLVTLPAEYRLYKSSTRRGSGLVLFVLIRYTSLTVLVLSNVGFFYNGFTPDACDHFHLVVPALQVVQIMVSQAILAIRTYNVSQRKRWVGLTLLSVYVMASGFQWFSSLFSRIPVMIDGNCSSASLHPHYALAAWSFYPAAMLFDCLTLLISTFYLMKVRAVASAVSASRLINSRLVEIIFYDGLGYFVALALSNVTNIILFRGTDNAIQTTGASLGYAFTWIMSQRILIHLHEARADQKSVEVPPSRAIPSPLRFDREKRTNLNAERDDTPTRSPGSLDGFGDTESAIELRVRIERSTVMESELQDRDSGVQNFDASPSGSHKFIWEQKYNV